MNSATNIFEATGNAVHDAKRILACQTITEQQKDECNALLANANRMHRPQFNHIETEFNALLSQWAVEEKAHQTAASAPVEAEPVKPAKTKTRKVEQSAAIAAKPSPTDKPQKKPASKDPAKKLTPESAAEKFINTENASTFAKCIIKSRFSSEEQRRKASDYKAGLSSTVPDDKKEVATRNFFKWYAAPNQADLVNAMQTHGKAKLKANNEKQAFKAMPETSTDDDIKLGKQTPSAKPEAQSQASKPEAAKRNPDDVTLTTFISNQHQSKTFTRDGTVIRKAFAKPMYKGTANRITIPVKDFLTKFPKRLKDASSCEAFCYGVFDDSLGDEVNVTTKKNVVEGVNISRSKEYMKHIDGYQVLMLDYDPSDYGTRMTPASHLEALPRVHPLIGGAMSVTRGSCSAGVHLKGKPPKTDAGFHTWMVVKDGRDIPRYGAVLFDRLWLAGFGFIALAKNGGMLDRSIIDVAVFGPERIDFEGKPILEGKGLVYTEPTITSKAGDVLDTTTLKSLTPDEKKQVKKLIDDAREAIKPQADAMRELWATAQVEKMMARGATEDEARDTINPILKKGVKYLSGAFILEFEGALGVVSVDDVLDDPDTFNGKALADPIEGTEYGTTTAMFYWNDGRPTINSQAHGGVMYSLPHQSSDEGWDVEVVLDAMFEALVNNPTACFADDVLTCLNWLADNDPLEFKKAMDRIYTSDGVKKTELKDALSRQRAMAKKAERDLKARFMQNRKPKGDAFVMRTVGSVNVDGDDNSGVFHNRSKDNNPIEVRISEPIWVEELTCTEEGGSHGRVFVFNKLNGEEVKLTAPMSLLSGTCEEFKKLLLAKGFVYDPIESPNLIRYLMSREPVRSRLIQTHIGWNKSLTSFVLPDKTIGDSELYFQPEHVGANKGLETSGSFEEWKKMAKLCEKNTVFALALCVNLSGPLLELLNAESGGVHIYGDSGSGKTSVVCIGSSVWGRGELGYFPKSWTSTLVGLMSAAAALSGTCLSLDEAGAATIDVGLAVYTLCNNSDKERGSKTGNTTQGLRWNIPIFSTGEHPLSKRDGSSTAGQEIRLADINADRKYLTLDDLCGFSSGAELALHFKDVSNTHYGHAGIALIEYLIKLINEGADFVAMRKAIITKWNPEPGQRSRMAERFAVLALTAEMAIAAKILDWKKGAGEKIMFGFYKEWVGNLGAGSIESNKIIENITDFIEKFGHSKFANKVDIDDIHFKSHSLAGFYLPASNSGANTSELKKVGITSTDSVFYVTSSGLREMAGDFPIYSVIKVLKEKNLLVCEGKKSTAKLLRLGLKPTKFYIISLQNYVASNKI